MHPSLQNILLTPGPEQEVRDWLDRVRAAGGTVNGQARDAVNVFVRQCKHAGIWSLFRRVNLCVGDFLASFIPLVNTSGSAADTNNSLATTDYAQELGWQTDGSTKFIDTGYTPTEATGGMGAYVRSSISSTTQVIMGCRDAGTTQIYRLANTVTVSQTFMWGETAGVTQNPDVLPSFLYGARTGATAIAIYKNGVSINSDTTSRTPATPSQAVYILCQNGGGTAATFCASGTRIAGYSIDSGMTAAQAAVYSDIMRRFQRSMARAFE